MPEHCRGPGSNAEAIFSLKYEALTADDSWHDVTILERQSARWLVSYDVEESSDSQTGIDVVEGHRENAVVGNGAPEQVRRVGGITGGGIYFDEEEGRVEESPGKASGLCAGNGTESGKDARSVVKDARDEVCRAIEEWVHPRFVRPRSIRCLAGECPPEPGTGVLATYRSDGRELYYDADVMDVRFWAREQHVLVQYVHGDIVGCSKWLLLSDVFRVADSTSILDEQRCNKLERNGKHTDASAHSVVDVMMQNGKDDLKILDSEGEQTMTSVLPQSQPGMGDGKKDRKKTCANVKTSSVVILHGMSDLSMHSNALDGSAVVAVDAHLRGPSGIQGVQQNEKDEVDYGEILRTWRTALPEMVKRFKKRLLDRFSFLPATVNIASGINVLLDGSGVLQYRVYVSTATGLPEIERLTNEQWTAAARLLQARGRLRKAAPSEVANCACVFERWHVPLDLETVRNLPLSVKLQALVAPGASSGADSGRCGRGGGSDDVGRVERNIGGRTCERAAEKNVEGIEIGSDHTSRAKDSVSIPVSLADGPQDYTHSSSIHQYFPALAPAQTAGDRVLPGSGSSGPLRPVGTVTVSEASDPHSAESRHGSSADKRGEGGKGSVHSGLGTHMHTSALTFKPLHKSWWPPTLDHVFLPHWNVCANTTHHKPIAVDGSKKSRMVSGYMQSTAHAGATTTTQHPVESRSVKSGWRVGQIHGIRALVSESIRKGSQKEDKILNPPAEYTGHVLLERIPESSRECPKGHAAWNLKIKAEGSEEGLRPGDWMRACGNTSLRPLRAIRLVLPPKLRQFMLAARVKGGSEGTRTGSGDFDSVRLGEFLETCGAIFDRSVDWIHVKKSEEWKDVDKMLEDDSTAGRMKTIVAGAKKIKLGVVVGIQKRTTKLKKRMRLEQGGGRRLGIRGNEPRAVEKKRLQNMKLHSEDRKRWRCNINVSGLELVGREIKLRSKHEVKDRFQWLPAKVVGFEIRNELPMHCVEVLGHPAQGQGPLWIQLKPGFFALSADKDVADNVSTAVDERDDEREVGERSWDKRTMLSSSAERKKHFSHIWDVNYENLKVFMQEHGHDCVPDQIKFEKLAAWVSKQRSEYLQKTLSQEKLRRLKSIGFHWTGSLAREQKALIDRGAGERGDGLQWGVEDPSMVGGEGDEDTWEGSGGTEVKHDMDGREGEAGTPLSVESQARRRLEREDMVRSEGAGCAANSESAGKDQFNQASAVGTRIKSPVDKRVMKPWEFWFEQLKLFMQKHKHDYPRRSGEQEQLSGWIAKQRHFYAHETLKHDRKQLLDRIGFHWTIATAKEHKKCVEEGAGERGNGMEWGVEAPGAGHEDKARKNCKKTEQDGKEAFTAQVVSQKEVKADHGHPDLELNVSTRQIAHKQKDQLDGEEFEDQLPRRKRKAEAMNQDENDGTGHRDRRITNFQANVQKTKQVRVSKVEQGGDKWREKYELLMAFKSMHGHPHINQDEPLGLWVDKQRKAYREKRLSTAREKLLRDMAFEFDHDAALSKRRAFESGAQQWSGESGIGCDGAGKDWTSIACHVCDSGDGEDRIILCDNCEKGWHLECLAPPLDAVPEGQWYCHGCTPIVEATEAGAGMSPEKAHVMDHDAILSKRNASQTGAQQWSGEGGVGFDGAGKDWTSIACHVCDSGDGEDRIILCDNCEKGWHLECLAPPLDAVPEGQWYCHGCTPIVEATEAGAGMSSEKEAEDVGGNKLEKQSLVKKDIVRSGLKEEKECGNVQNGIRVNGRHHAENEEEEDSGLDTQAPKSKHAEPQTDVAVEGVITADALLSALRESDLGAASTGTGLGGGRALKHSKLRDACRLGIAMLEGLRLPMMTKPYNKQAPREKLCMTLKAFLDGGLGGGTEGWHSLRKELLLLERNVTWKAMLSNYDRGQLLKSAMDHPSFEGTYEMMVALVKALKYSAWHANFLRPLGLLLDGEEDNVQEPEQALDDGRVAAEIKEGEVANDVEAEVKDATDQQMEIQEVRPLDPHALLTAIRRTHKDAANGVWIRDESSGKGEGGGRIKKSPLQGKKGKVEGSASTSTAAKAHEVQDALKLGIALLEGTQSFVLSKPLNKVADRERLKASFEDAFKAVSSATKNQAGSVCSDRWHSIRKELLRVERNIVWKAVTADYNRENLMPAALDDSSFHGTYLLLLELTRCIHPSGWKPRYLKSLNMDETAQATSKMPSGMEQSKASAVQEAQDRGDSLAPNDLACNVVGSDTKGSGDAAEGRGRGRVEVRDGLSSGKRKAGQENAQKDGSRENKDGVETNEAKQGIIRPRARPRKQRETDAEGADREKERAASDEEVRQEGKKVAPVRVKRKAQVLGSDEGGHSEPNKS